MVSSNNQENPFQSIIDAPVDKVMDAITDYFKDYYINFILDLDEESLINAIINQDEDVMKAYLKENIFNIHINDTGRVQYDLYILQGINEHQNPLHHIPVSILTEIIEAINITSYTILTNDNRNPPLPLMEQHPTENMEEMLIEYVGTLYYWYGYNWLRNIDMSSYGHTTSHGVTCDIIIEDSE